jgi:hypothetical protein
MRVPAMLRSWRFRIVALVTILLAVIGGAGLWYRHRPLTPNEKQLVGYWHIDVRTGANTRQVEYQGYLDFHPDRTLTLVGWSPPLSKLSWWVERDVLVIRVPPQRMLRSLGDWIQSGLPQSTSTRYEIHSLDPPKGSVVHLVSGPDGDRHITLTRVEPAPGTDPAP